MLKQSLLKEISSIDNLEDLMVLGDFVMKTRNSLGKNTLMNGYRMGGSEDQEDSGVITKMKVKKNWSR